MLSNKNLGYYKGSPSLFSARVGHGFLFLALADSGDGFRQSAITGVVFMYGAYCSRADTGKDFQTMTCLMFLLCFCLL